MKRLYQFKIVKGKREILTIGVRETIKIYIRKGWFPKYIKCIGTI